MRAEIQKAVRLAAQTYSVRFCLWYCFNYLSQLQYRDKWGPAPCCALYQDHKPDSLRWSRKTAGCLGPQSLSSATLDCDQLGNFSWRMRSINVRRWAGVQNLKNGQVHHQSRKLPASLYKKCQLLSRSHNTVARSWRKATLCPGWLRSQETTRSSHCLTLLNYVKLFISRHSKTLCHPKGLVHSLARRIASLAALQVVVNLTMAAIVDPWLTCLVSLESIDDSNELYHQRSQSRSKIRRMCPSRQWTDETWGMCLKSVLLLWCFMPPVKRLQKLCTQTKRKIKK